MNKPMQSDLHNQHTLSRLYRLQEQIVSVLPAARFAGPAIGFLDALGFMVTMPNRVEVMISPDADVPAILFEVYRVDSAPLRCFPFETRYSAHSTLADKLSTQAVVDLLRQYAAVPSP